MLTWKHDKLKTSLSGGGSSSSRLQGSAAGAKRKVERNRKRANMMATQASSSNRCRPMQLPSKRLHCSTLMVSMIMLAIGFVGWLSSAKCLLLGNELDILHQQQHSVANHEPANNEKPFGE